MRVAVVTPYHRESLPTLRRAHESVRRQTHACTHIFVADGHPRRGMDDWDALHIKLPEAHGDYGNTPRAIGGISALNRGYDAVAYLDADNWYAPDHIESLVRFCEAESLAVAFSDRQIVLSTGELCPFVDRDEHERQHVDTNCFLITSRAAFLLPMWAMMNPELSAAGDRAMLAIIRRRAVPHGWTGRQTLFYESRWPGHFVAMGKPVPADAHNVDHGAIRDSYSPERAYERLGFDPFGGAPDEGKAVPRGSGPETLYPMSHGEYRS